MYADTVRSPDLRFRIPHAVADPFLYIEDDGVQRVVVPALEVQRMRNLSDLESYTYEEFGLDELRRQGVPAAEVPRRIATAACRRFGIGSAAIPPDFPVAMADHLRGNGISLDCDDEAFVARRRVKTPLQLDGIRRAQKGAEAAVDAIRALLATADIAGDSILLDGEPLTSERLKVVAREAFAATGVGADEFIVAHGYQTCVGHHMGSGPIGLGEPITVDIWPRDEETGCFADMTRTYVVGPVDDELATYHRLAYEALEHSIEAMRPGVPVADVYGIACEVFEAAGFATQRTKRSGEVLLDGFFHSLGHGVGLEVHEAPQLAQSDEVLAEGEVLAVEPGCYRQGFGGVRLEDLVLITSSGADRLTNYGYQLSPGTRA